MQIIHKIDDFLYSIFPTVPYGDTELLVTALRDFYTIGPFEPKVTIADYWINIEVDTSSILGQNSDFKKVVAFCEKGNYAAAKPILIKLLEKNPTNSEYHRILGQIHSDEGDQEEAINCLIDALRWDSKNGWALLLLGNIFAKFKNDIDTAMRYYDHALVANPDDNITINNIGANLMQQGKLEDAKKYFNEAVKIDDQYPNTHYALGMISEMEGDLHAAFDSTIQAIKVNKNRDGLYQSSVRQALAVSNSIIASDEGKDFLNRYQRKLELEGDRKVEIIEDQDISTAAKFEFAENYNRETHIVKYKPSYPAVEHLIMHELVHLDFVIAARKNDVNQLFISTKEHRSAFYKSLEPTIKKLGRMGVSEKTITDYSANVFEGMNRQVFNAPVDLFIENFLYSEFPELRPFQFLSLYGMLQEGIKAVTDKKIIELSPAEIVSKSKVYNIVSAFQFKELFGLDFIKDFRATAKELTLAVEFYDEYLLYKDNKKPATEYRLVLHWAETLKLQSNFELIDELEFRTRRTDAASLLKAIEKDPYDLNSRDPYKQREMDKFQKSQQVLGPNMAVVMFMVDALQYFDDKPAADIKNVAIEIAMLGTQGYRPDKEDYRISSIAGKTFSGFHILAYYYVSWALAIPEMLSQLKLPYDEEYALALTMHKPKNS